MVADEANYWIVQKSTGKQVQKEDGTYEWEVETYPIDDLTALFEDHRGLYRGDQDAWVAEVQKGEVLAMQLGLLIREANAEDMEKHSATFQRRKWADDWRNADSVAAATKADRTAKLVVDFNDSVTNADEAARFFSTTKLNTRDFLVWLKTAHQASGSTVKLKDHALRAFEEYRTAKSPLVSKRLTGADALTSIKDALGRKRATPKSKAKKQATDS